MDLVRQILLKHPSVYSLRIPAGGPIEVEVDISEESDSNIVLDFEKMPLLLADIVHKVQLTSIENAAHDSPSEFIAKLVQRIDEEGGVARFVVVGDDVRFSRWYSEGRKSTLQEVEGMSVHPALGHVQPDAAVICVGPTKVATPLEVSRGYLIHLDTTRPKERQV